MPSPPADEERMDRPWRDFEGYVQDAVHWMRSAGWGRHIDSIEFYTRKSFKTIADIGTMIDAPIEFQDKSRPNHPAEEARFRLSLDGRSHLVFEGQKEFNEWVRVNREMLRARVVRTQLGEISAIRSESKDRLPSRARRAL